MHPVNPAKNNRLCSARIVYLLKPDKPEPNVGRAMPDMVGVAYGYLKSNFGAQADDLDGWPGAITSRTADQLKIWRQFKLVVDLVAIVELQLRLPARGLGIQQAISVEGA